MKPIAVLGVPEAKHLYEVRVSGVEIEDVLEVHANTSTQAAKIASEAGYVVRSTNMVG